MRALMAVMAIVVGCVASAPGELPADMLRLGDIRLATAEEASGAISRDEALAAASVDYGTRRAQAFLMVPMEPEASQRFDDPINRTMTCVVRYDDLNFDGPAPLNASGERPSRPPLDYLYVVVDA